MGTFEWHRRITRSAILPLAGDYSDNDEDDEDLQCVALGTGMRCLPASKLAQANGRCLHDWHAEIVAIRSLNAHLLSECTALAGNSQLTSRIVRRRLQTEVTTIDFQPFAIQDGVKLLMYCSEAPCGDASMELVMQAQDDATPWSSPEVSDDTLRGRGHFSELGVVRRKPARADAPESLSKSCSDKMALKQCTSVLSSVSSLLIHPGNAYIHSLIVPESQFSKKSYERAFSATGRLSTLKFFGNGLKEWPGGYSFRPFNFVTTRTEFKYSRHSLQSGAKSIGSNLAAAWTPQAQQTLIGGSIQGHKQFSARGNSFISRANLWKVAAQVASLVGIKGIQNALQRQYYQDIKHSALLSQRRVVKEDVKASALRGWKTNTGDDHFSVGINS